MAETKTKRPPVDKDEKAFVAFTKLIFGSMSARMCTYAYFNVDSEHILLCNSTVGGVGSEHGDRFMNYRVGELSLHYITIKDTEYLRKLKELIQCPETGIWVLRTNVLLSLLNKHRLAELKLYSDIGDVHYLVPKALGPKAITGPKSMQDFGIFGAVKNFHVLHEINAMTSIIRMVDTEEFNRNNPHMLVDMPADVSMNGKEYCLEYKFNPDGKSDREIRIAAMDGITSVSYKEFIKKLPTTDTYEFKMYLWSAGTDSVMSMTSFENDKIKVRTFRPNLIIMTLPDNLKFQKDNQY